MDLIGAEGNMIFPDDGISPKFQQMKFAGMSFINAGARIINAGVSFMNAGLKIINAGARIINAGERIINAGTYFINAGASFMNEVPFPGDCAENCGVCSINCVKGGRVFLDESRGVFSITSATFTLSDKQHPRII